MTDDIAVSPAMIAVGSLLIEEALSEMDWQRSPSDMAVAVYIAMENARRHEAPLEQFAKDVGEGLKIDDDTLARRLVSCLPAKYRRLTAG